MQPRNPEAERRALETLDAYMETFNAHDWDANARTLNYPHVRVAGGKVTVWASVEDYARDNPERIRRTFEGGWHHSAFDERAVLQAGADKVHVMLRFTRYDAAGTALASYPSLWIVTLVDGHWGVQARSSFAR